KIKPFLGTKLQASNSFTGPFQYGNNQRNVISQFIIINFYSGYQFSKISSHLNSINLRQHA
ncbi:MAG: hypothetical protein P8X83_08330, partial [Nitrosopumilaceae archaeon]